MKNRDSMILYRSFYDAIKLLPDSIQLEIFKAIFEFGLDGVEPELSQSALPFWLLIKPNLQANRTKWESGCKAKSKQDRSNTEAEAKQNGSKTEAKQKQGRSKTEANVDVDVDEDVNENEKVSRRFIKPSESDLIEATIAKYPNATQETCRKFAEKFIAHYESNGWKVGKNPMKSWKACISTWSETIEKLIASQTVAPTQTSNYRRVMLDQLNHNNYDAYVDWCIKNGETPEPDKYPSKWK